MELVGSYSFNVNYNGHVLNGMTAKQFCSIISDTTYSLYLVHIYADHGTDTSNKRDYSYNFIFPPISFNASSDSRLVLTTGGYQGTGDLSIYGVSEENYQNKIVLSDRGIGNRYSITMKLYRIKI